MFELSYLIFALGKAIYFVPQVLEPSPSSSISTTSNMAASCDGASKKLNLVVFGATGRTGKEVVKQALEKGHHVTAVVRTPEKMDTQ